MSNLDLNNIGVHSRDTPRRVSTKRMDVDGVQSKDTPRRVSTNSIFIIGYSIFTASSCPRSPLNPKGETQPAVAFTKFVSRFNDAPHYALFSVSPPLFPMFWLILNFTIRLTRSRGRGLSSGNCMVPFEVLYTESSFSKAAIPDAVGKKPI